MYNFLVLISGHSESPIPSPPSHPIPRGPSSLKQPGLRIGVTGTCIYTNGNRHIYKTYELWPIQRTPNIVRTVPARDWWETVHIWRHCPTTLLAGCCLLDTSQSSGQTGFRRHCRCGLPVVIENMICMKVQRFLELNSFFVFLTQ